MKLTRQPSVGDLLSQITALNSELQTRMAQVGSELLAAETIRQTFAAVESGLKVKSTRYGDYVVTTEWTSPTATAIVGGTEFSSLRHMVDADGNSVVVTAIVRIYQNGVVDYLTIRS